MSSLCVALIGGSMVLGQAPLPESNYEHLKEFAEAYAGDWIGDFEVDFDIPGLVKKGDKATFRASTNWILDKTALQLDWKADINGKPAGSGRALIGWDRSTKQIVSFGFGSFGGCAKSGPLAASSAIPVTSRISTAWGIGARPASLPSACSRAGT